MFRSVARFCRDGSPASARRISECWPKQSSALVTSRCCRTQRTDLIPLSLGEGRVRAYRTRELTHFLISDTVREGCWVVSVIPHLNPLAEGEGEFEWSSRTMAHKQVLLREDIDNLGGRGEVVRVKAGYARNYLLPRKLAVEATASNVKQIESERAALLKREAKEHSTAAGHAEQLRNL